jgi:phosphate transport system substrate-binding protein
MLRNTAEASTGDEMTLRASIKGLALVAGLALAGQLAAAPVQVDAGIPAYERVADIRGNATSIGSDTMNNLMTLWLEAFRRHYPQVTIMIEGKGSSTAPTALIEGTAQFGPMSRPMKNSEIDQFEAKYGFEPTAIRTGLDALAVFVPKDNPIEGLGLDQVDAIFSATRKRGLAPITSWGQLLPESPVASRPISLYGRNSASGTYGYFKDEALKKGDLLNEVKEQPGSAAVVQGVAGDQAGIGYSGIGYTTSGVRAVPLSQKAGGPYFETNYENVISGDYPLARPLLLYVVSDPNQPMDPLVREFLKFILSREGQEIVVRDGYLPLPAAEAARELAKFDR